MVYLNYLHSSINYTYEKAKVTRAGKGSLVQILNLDVNVMYLMVKMKFLEIYIIKI